MNAKNNHSERSSDSDRENAFTFIELLVVIGVIAFCAILVLPTMARTRNSSALSQCQNNLKQLASSWTMYSADNKGSLVSAYPSYAGFQGSWCRGNAASFGGAGAYVYGGADPAGITNGLIWPYVKSLSAYKCPLDNRVSLPGSPFVGQPILRSVTMNCYMAGANFGTASSFNVFFGGTQDPKAPVFLKGSEISRPSGTWVILDEDPQSINDGMFLVDMGGAGRGFVDLPSRLHSNGYGINFADGHTEYIKLTEPSSLNWVVGGPTINNDWRKLTNITTAPLN